MNSKGYTEGLARDTAQGIHIPSWVFPIRLEFYLKTAGQEFVFFSCSVHSCPAVFHSCPAVFILVLQSFNRIGLPLTIFSLFFSVFVIILDICGIHLHHFSKSCFNSFFYYNQSQNLQWEGLFCGANNWTDENGGGCFCVIHCISFLVSDKSGRRFYSDFLSQEAGLNIILLCSPYYLLSKSW